MPDFLPAIELAAKSVRNAFAAIGAVAHAMVPPAENFRDALLDFEEKNEVLEPPSAPKYGMTCVACDGDIATCGCFDDFGPCECVCDLCAAGGHCDTASCATVGDGEPPIGEFYFGYNQYLPLPQTPAASATVAAVTDPDAGRKPAPASGVTVESLTWMGWSLPAIFDVLSDHMPSRQGHGQDGYIRCMHIGGEACCELPDWQSWREHVGPILADRIGCDPVRAAAALLTYTPK